MKKKTNTNNKQGLGIAIVVLFLFNVYWGCEGGIENFDVMLVDGMYQVVEGKASIGIEGEEANTVDLSGGLFQAAQNGKYVVVLNCIGEINSSNELDCGNSKSHEIGLAGRVEYTTSGTIKFDNGAIEAKVKMHAYFVDHDMSAVYDYQFSAELY